MSEIVSSPQIGAPGGWRFLVLKIRRNNMVKVWQNMSCAVALCGGLLPGANADETAELAKAAQNPIAALISLPVQVNYDDRYGAQNDGKKWVTYVQPVIPFSINNDWSLISRTIVPLINQKDIAPAGAMDKSGVGDVTQSFFFSPKKSTADGWIWGAGPVVLLPTASDKLLGGEKWGLGPTAVVLRQRDGWTYGALTNHIWSVAGESRRDDISVTFLEPFLSYTTKTYTTFGVNTESTYDWKTGHWSVPVNFAVTQMMRVGTQALTLSAGARYWADSPPGGAEGWGFRFALTLLFPR
jgi:hypothetical protein